MHANNNIITTLQIMGGQRHTTIKDIAREMGLSTSTISRALSDSWDVNLETRNEVLKVAKRLNYKPNPIAQKLRAKRTKTIGVVVPEIINSFFPKVIIGIQSVLNENGYQLLITQSNESIEQEEQNIKMLEDNMVEGLIISVTKDGANLSLYQRILESGMAAVFFNRANSKVKAPKVMTHDKEMSSQVVQHLYDIGCRKIAHLSGPASMQISKLREEGYKEGLVRCGITIADELIMEGGIGEQGGYDATKRLLQSSETIDAIFAFSDPSAIGSMRAIKEAGLSIPNDIAVVGFSDSKSAMMVEPNLTSVRQPTYEMGCKAATLLLKIINNESEKGLEQTIYLDSELMIRESSKR